MKTLDGYELKDGEDCFVMVEVPSDYDQEMNSKIYKAKYKSDNALAMDWLYEIFNFPCDDTVDVVRVWKNNPGSDAMWNKIMYPGPVVESIDIDTAIEYLAKARYSHQYYIDNPEKLTVADIARGRTVEFHQGCVDRYTAIINLLESLKDE